MNILVTLNSNYLEQLIVMLKSLAYNNKHKEFDIYVMNDSLTKKDINYLKENVMNNINIIDLKINDKELNKNSNGSKLMNVLVCYIGIL